MDWEWTRNEPGMDQEYSLKISGFIIAGSFLVHSSGLTWLKVKTSKLCLNWANVLKFNLVLFACAVAMASSNSCSFQEAASPSFMNDKKNPIFFRSPPYV